MKTHKQLPLMLAALAVFLTAGCRSLGPRTVPKDRADYSSSISESWKRQTLLNIVKLRYLDPPIFVDVGQIVAGYSLETALTAGGSFPQTTMFGGDTATVGGSARFTDRPTITYTPLTGNAFIKSLMTPLPPESVFFTIQSGWPADSVLLATAAAINGLKNQETSVTGVTPPDREFIRVLQLMRGLQRSGHVGMRVKMEPDNRHSSILTIRSKDIPADVQAEAEELRRLLKLDPQQDEFTLVFGNLPTSRKEVAVLTRSMLHIMNTMAALVDVPAKDVEEGRATPGADQAAAGEERLVRIHSGADSPADAFVSVRYRDRWFWIDDRDLRTKRAFAFMLTLFTLAESGKPETPPLITIPAQ